MPIQQCPAYHEGFWDAGNLEPLFPDADAVYAAGWVAYWEIREMLQDPTKWRVNMITGTSHFVSKLKAIRYYRDYEGDLHAPHAVERKLKEGQIHIGPPELKPGQKLSVIDSGTRYAIED